MSNERRQGQTGSSARGCSMPTRHFCRRNSAGSSDGDLRISSAIAALAPALVRAS
jgi:hypothetical protein